MGLGFDRELSALIARMAMSGGSRVIQKSEQDRIVISGSTIHVLGRADENPAPKLKHHEYTLRTHPRSECEHRAVCMVHAPTNHLMSGWPLNWRNDRGIFERLCSHGIGHPDPDQWSWWIERAQRRIARGGDEFDDLENRRITPEDEAFAETIHGCDGCCKESI